MKYTLEEIDAMIESAKATIAKEEADSDALHEVDMQMHDRQSQEETISANQPRREDS